ncbi:hypothetical protein HN670_03080 [bacterium]|jgi:hypothetical protein|nr:hypothetical protein [bacterium]
MDKKKKKFLWLAIIILVIVGLIWLTISLLKFEPVDDSIYSTDSQPRFETNSPEFTEPVAISPEKSTEFTIENLSRTFAERFGSWSTDNPGQNLADLNAIITANFEAELENLISYQERDFYGVTSKAISTKIQFLDESGGQAEVLVGTQRISTDEDLNQSTEYQGLLVGLILNNNTWLVNQAEWQ